MKKIIHLKNNAFKINQNLLLRNKDFLILGLFYSVKKEQAIEAYIMYKDNIYNKQWIKLEEIKGYFLTDSKIQYEEQKEIEHYELENEIYFRKEGIIYKGIINDVLLESKLTKINNKNIIENKIFYKIKYKSKKNKKYTTTIILETDIMMEKKVAIKELKENTIKRISLHQEEQIKKEIIEINTPLGIGQIIDIYKRRALILQLNYSLKFNRMIQGYIHYIDREPKNLSSRHMNWRMLNKENEILTDSKLYQQYFNVEILSTEQNVFFKFENLLYAGKIKDIIINIKENEKKELELNIYYKIKFKVQGRTVSRHILLTETEFSFNKEESLKEFINESINELN